MDHIEDMRKNVTLQEHEVINVHSTDFPNAYYGYNDNWDFEKFKSNFKINVIRFDEKEREMEFDMIGVDAAIANAVRRILLAEVPTMAIEKAFIYNNTSVMQDEVLAHRLGLIPLDVDARYFEFKPKTDDGNAGKEDESTTDAGSSEHTLEFELKVKCTKNPDVSDQSSDPNHMYKNSKVFSKDIKWIPIGNQKDMITAKPLHDDILIVKMRPGHEIDIKLHAVKGIGRDHAKFSPVATASYRLLPRITLLKKVCGPPAFKLQKCFSKGVVDVVENEFGENQAVVRDARKDTCSREVLRHPDLKDSVKLSKVRDHFIFSVESAVGLTPDVLVTESIKVLMSKCKALLRELDSSSEQMDTS